MTRTLQIGSRPVGDGHPVYIIAEIGINHNGSLDNAKRLIDAASDAGCDAVKFQKRTPELCVPEAQKSKMRETPWGYITYLEYRHKVEFWKDAYEDIAAHCRARNIDWFASCWDEEAVEFMELFNPPCYKVQSAAVTDSALLTKLRETGRPLLLSTGMSTMDEIRSAVSLLDVERLLIMHATSTYPCPNTQLNLNMIRTLRDVFPCPVGYSGHEVGLPTTAAAVALGACAVERHITLDRSMWGSDQAASIEPGGFKRLVTYIRAVEDALGDGIKQVYPEESIARERLRRV